MFVVLKMEFQKFVLLPFFQVLGVFREEGWVVGAAHNNDTFNLNDIFSQYFSKIFNESIETDDCPKKLKCAGVRALLVLYLLYAKYSNIVFMIKSIET